MVSEADSFPQWNEMQCSGVQLEIGCTFMMLFALTDISIVLTLFRTPPKLNAPPSKI